MVIFFSEEDIVSFGNYLISDFKTKFEEFRNLGNKIDVNFIDRMKGVTPADLENWAYLMNNNNGSTNN